MITRATLVLSIVLLGLSFCHPSYAQDEIIDIWIANGVEFTSQESACASFEQNADTSQFRYSAWRASSTRLDRCQADREKCYDYVRGVTLPLSECDAGNFASEMDIVGRDVEQGTRLADDNNCDAGNAFKGSYETGGTEAPTSLVCQGNCAASIVHQVALSVAGDPDATKWLFVAETDGSECSGNDNSATVTASFGDSENTAYNTDGSETTYPAPDPPPADIDPDTAGDQPPVPDSTDTSDTGGLTVDTYTTEDGSQVYVVTDSNGNITFTDITPSNGTATYTASTGSGDGTGTGSGTGDGDGGETGSGDGTGDGEEGDGEDESSVSGGGVCDSAPICTGDPVNCAIVMQAWNNRCEVQELKDDLLTEVDSDTFTGMAVADEIFGSIETFGDDFANVEGEEGLALRDAFVSDEGENILDVIPDAGSGGFSFMNVELMGATFNFGSGLETAWTNFAPVFAFGMYLLTATGIYMMWFGALAGIKP